jgi:putative endonuclease
VELILAVYILASKRSGTPYRCLPSDLVKSTSKIWGKLYRKYGVYTLVYFEMHDEMTEAIRARNNSRNGTRCGRLN